MSALSMAELFRLCVWGTEYREYGNDVDLAFSEQGSELYVFFRGSDSVVDWVRNFMFGKRPYRDMAVPYRVHRGFLAAWKEVEDLVIERVSDPKWGSVTVVGYSHGAALAGLCHECVWFHRPDLRDAGLRGYGFESPRFFASWRVPKALRERWATFTVTRCNSDIVTRCPPALLGFTHVSKPVQLRGDPSASASKAPPCVKSHLPEVVLDGLMGLERLG